MRNPLHNGIKFNNRQYLQRQCKPQKISLNTLSVNTKREKKKEGKYQQTLNIVKISQQWTIAVIKVIF